ncbi:uncharacterized protein Bfra_000935 [Botrytis fragariae]|uniref:Uncharacterized protein n=1 Tax=Botrytis fragariae TaxID=1964551 RepID=A0A8H6B3M0_9HELO|nr:uncharacterized protein Bfra_000935 [Botrytis fragariae]KAF5878766.1 hypothetical protein Bfra_000935 [Botrytis fragariae]
MPRLKVTQNALQNNELGEERLTSGYYIQPDPLHIMIVGQSTEIFYAKIALGAQKGNLKSSKTPLTRPQNNSCYHFECLNTKSRCTIRSSLRHLSTEALTTDPRTRRYEMEIG